MILQPSSIPIDISADKPGIINRRDVQRFRKALRQSLDEC
ncbi:hypothetical protein ATN83_2548 [Raoultella ornithinolytica]|nr:hypothetical protein ATN83_2548 [Raoultella ornithinolytica]KDX14577.1 hypothetical protein AB28_2680 [Raoultella ornithinolytica 2-156-04_S1_C2]